MTHIPLIKSKTYAGQAGYYLLNGRWHKVKSGHSVPKGVPMAAHPHAAGQHTPLAHLSDSEWSQLKLPAENVNAKTFNKQIDKMQDMANAGHVTGILGMQYGTNTYGKKLAVIANHILGIYGVDHKVTAGQKAGEHEAVQAEKSGEGNKLGVIGQAMKDKLSEPESAPKSISEKLKESIQQQNGAKPAKAKAESKSKAVPAKTEDATAPKDGDTKQGAEGTLVLKDGHWIKQGEPEAKAKPSAKQDEPESAKKSYVSGDVVKDKWGDVFKLTEDPADGMFKGKDASTGMVVTFPEKNIVGHATAAEHADKAIPIPVFSGGKTGYSVISYYTGVAKKIKAAVEAGDLSALEKMKADGLVPNSSGKVSNTWAGKTQNSKALLGMHADAIKHLGEKAKTEEPKAPGISKDAKIPAKQKSILDGFAESGDKEALSTVVKNNEHNPHIAAYAQKLIEGMGASAADKVKQATQAATAKVSDTAEHQEAVAIASSKASTDKLSMIPWDAQLLPDSNKNAKSHNNQVAKIKAMAEAGDMAGLEAFKAGTNTYGKKQNLLAQTALAALKEDGAKVAAPEKKELSGAYGAIAEQADTGLSDIGGNDTQSQLDAIGWDGLLMEGSSYYAKQNNAKIKQIKDLAYLGDTDGLVDFLDNNTGYGTSLAEKALGILGTQYVPKAKEASSKEKPAKPVINQSNHWNDVASDIEQAIEDGDLATVQKIIDTTGGLQSPNAVAIHTYAKSAAEYLGANSGSAAEAHPKDGDTKQGASGMLVFKNGRWHKVGDDLAGVDVKGIAEKISAYLASGQSDTPEHAEGKLYFEQLSQEHQDALTGNKKAAVKKLKPSEAIALGKGLKTATGVKAILKKMAVEGDVDGLQEFIKTHPKLHASKKYANNLINAMTGGGTGAVAAAVKAPEATPEPSPNDGIESMDSWEQIGPQGGSNPGGKFKDGNGVEWYCKFPSDPDVAKSEVLAAKLYEAAGVAGQKAKLIMKDGKLGIASAWTDVSKASSPTQLSKIEGVAAGFAVDAWLGNWDVVGLEYDNLQVGADGKAVRVDAGGSLTYRAQGGKKPFTEHVTEIDSLRDKAINPQAAAVFGKLSKADITASVKKVLSVPDSLIYHLVDQYGGTPEEKKSLAETLIARKKDLASKFPAAAKKKAKPFNPDKISTPPSFMSWGETGKPGPSSKDFLNQANEDAVQAILAAAKTGKIDSVKAIEADVYDKNTGEVTGKAAVLQHPSQHVSGYANQVINEIEHQLNPPKRFRFEGGHPLHALNDAYPATKGAGHLGAVKTVGKFIELGKPGVVSVESLGLNKNTYYSGTLDQKTYASQAQAAISKMPATQRQAVASYTGSGYKQMNDSLWSGNPSGAAKAAGEAIKTLGHTIEPGVVLSRKLTVSGEALSDLLKSHGKVLQEPAIMSTSIRPTSWSGNVQLKMHVGPGVKGLWVGKGSLPNGGALSNHAHEDEMILPPNTRILIVSVSKGGSQDADNFGHGVNHVIEAIILPSNG